jgi:hypothetical protein
MIWAVGVLGLLGATGPGAGSVASAATGPRFAHTVLLEPVSGEVLVSVPGQSAYARLTAARLVPIGTLVDTTSGRVRLTSAGPPSGQLQSGEFFRGIFQVRQSAYGHGLVNLVIRDTRTMRSMCTAPAVHSAALSRRILGLLRGTANGRFRTTGRFAAATVRGTDWGVRDRCDGTLTVVRRGVVAVRDFRLHKTVIVRAGQTYLAKAP